MRQIGDVAINIIDAGRRSDTRILQLKAVCGDIVLEKSLTIGLGGDTDPGKIIEAEIAAFAVQTQRTCDQNLRIDEYLAALDAN